MTTATEMVMPNWRKNWPTMPFTNATGTNTATIVSVVASTLSAISLVPSSAACARRLAALEVLEDVFAHDDRVVDEEADGQRQAEQRHHVQRVAEHVHDEERGDDAGRQRDGADERRAQIEHEDQDDEDGHGAAEDDVELDLVHLGLDDRAPDR